MELLLADKGCLSLLANLSTIVACLTAIFTLIFSSCQFFVTQKSTRESQAVELFLKFNQLNVDQEKTSSDTSNLSNLWYGNCKFTITESLYEISHHSVTWQSTIIWMLDKQRDFIREGDFEVDTYSEKFRTFCKKSGFEIRRQRS